MDDVMRMGRELFRINEMAYEQYRPMAIDLCTREAAEDEVEQVLDRMLDFCGYDKMLELFKKVCRKYFEIYPEMITFEINGYREIYDSESYKSDTIVGGQDNA